MIIVWDVGELRERGMLASTEEKQKAEFMWLGYTYMPILVLFGIALELFMYYFGTVWYYFGIILVLFGIVVLLW